MTFQIHVQTPPVPPYSAVRDTWLALEAAGADAIWTWDHFFTEVTPGDFEGWSLLAALAEATSRVRIGVLVTAATFRHPSLLAKMAMTVDHVSGGRLLLGLGLARLEAEHVAFGLPWYPAGERLRRLRETLDVVDGLATGSPFSYSGRHAVLSSAVGAPGFVSSPRPPVLIGAHGRRLLRLTAARAEMWNGFGSPAQHAEFNRVLDVECSAVGRDPRSLLRLPSVGPSAWDASSVAAYREAGADGMIMLGSSNDAAGLAAAVQRVRLLT